MRLFIVKVCLFLALLFLVMGMVFAPVVCAEWWAYRKAIKMPEGAIVAVCSDSQTETSLNPAWFPELFNFSASSAPVEEYALRAEDIFKENNNQLKAVMFDISPMKIGSDRLSPDEMLRSGAREHFMVWCFHPTKGVRLWSVAFKLFRENVFLKKFSNLRYFFRSEEKQRRRYRVYQSTISGGFMPIETAAFIEKRNLAMTHAREKAAEVRSGSSALNQLREIIGILRERSVRVILISSRLHPSLLNAIGEHRLDRFRTSMRTFSAEVDVPWLDYINVEFEDEAWKDGNHLNVLGARRFTARVRGDVLKLL